MATLHKILKTCNHRGYCKVPILKSKAKAKNQDMKNQKKEIKKKYNAISFKWVDISGGDIFQSEFNLT